MVASLCGTSGSGIRSVYLVGAEGLSSGKCGIPLGAQATTPAPIGEPFRRAATGDCMNSAFRRLSALTVVTLLGTPVFARAQASSPAIATATQEKKDSQKPTTAETQKP